MIAAILVVGFGSALAIYATAGPVAELLDWFQSLWHGRRLAATVACLTILSAAAVWLVDAVFQE